MDSRTLMDAAAKLARPHHPHPNPRVGAVIVSTRGDIVGEGAHRRHGGPHAEVEALRAAGARAAGGTAVVTLEPCHHHGRTPPCTEALISAGLARVVVGVVDPDARVAGRGIAALRAAGMEVIVLEDQGFAEAIDPGYFHHRRTGRPRVTLKSAMTLDGQTGAGDGSSQWVTSVEARRDGHVLRSAADAVMVGAGTVLADDPLLTVRLGRDQQRQPRPVIIAGRRPLPPTAAVFGRDPLVYATVWRDLPGEVVVVGGGDRVDLAAVMADLGDRGIVDLLVEGGATLAGVLESAGLIDRYVLYFAAAVAGGTGIPAFGGLFDTMGAERRVDIVAVERIGPDIKVEATRRDE